MVYPLLLLLFLPFLAPACIDWTKCDKATCFSKYANRDGLSIFGPGMTATDTGVQLSRDAINAKVTTVSIEVKTGGMQDDDWAAIVVGDIALAGCYKGTKPLEIASMRTKINDPTKRELVSDVFCCIVNVEHLKIDLFPVSSATHLALNYTSNNGETTVSLPTDFSTSVILESIDHREKVLCDIKSFQVESSTVVGEKPYYPMQNPFKARCGVVNHAIKQVNGSGHTGEIRVVPVCDGEKKTWSLDNKQVDFDTMPLRCMPRPKQLRRSCAGFAPPAEIRCGRLCGPMDPNFFKCHEGTTLQFLDGSFEWQKVDADNGIHCTDRGYVAIVSKQEIRLSSEAKVQCKVNASNQPSISFLAFPRPLAAFIGFLIYASLFGGGTFALHIIFSRWAKRVEEIGPIRSPYGPMLSTRATRNKDNNNNTNNGARDESNRNNTPSHKSTGLSARSSKK